jgi:hypothetical protein
MTPISFRRGTALRVFWVDSTQTPGWIYEKLPTVQVERVATLGWAVNSSVRGLNLTSTLSTRGGALSLVTIPWAAITDIQELEEWNRDANLPK